MNSNRNISNFGGAVKLDYSGIGMDSTDAKVLAELLKANITVQGLDASSNSLGPEGAKALAASIAENRTITSVSYQQNAFLSTFLTCLSFPSSCLCFLYLLGVSSSMLRRTPWARPAPRPSETRSW